MSVLATSHISLAYKKRTILQDISLSFRHGEFVGIIGPNGAGKTTLLKILCGLQKNYSGQVLFKEKDLRQWTPNAVARELAYLPQGHDVHWPISVTRMVELGRLPHGRPWQGISPEDSRIVATVLRELSLEHLAHQPVTKLSGGERARVALARVLATRTEVIFADEPVAALDPYHQLHVMGLLRQLAHDGYLVCSVLHDLPLAARYCDRVIVLHDGSVIADGPPRVALSAENLGRAFGIVPHNSEICGEFLSLPWALAK